MFYRLLKSYNFTTLAGTIAFFFIVNGGSLAFLISLTLNLFHFDYNLSITNNNTIKQILTYLNLSPSNGYTPYYIVLIATSIWSSSTFFYHIIKTGELIYKTMRKPYHFFHRITSIILVFIFIVIILISLVLLLILNYLNNRINNSFIKLTLKVSLYFILPIVIIIYFMLFVPPIRLKINEIYKGTLFTIIFWFLISILFRVYLNIFTNFKAIYGALTFLIITMIYIYLLAIGLVIGLIVNLEEISKIKNKNILTITNGDTN